MIKYNPSVALVLVQTHNPHHNRFEFRREGRILVYNSVPIKIEEVYKNKPNCAISSSFAVTYCTNVGLGLAGRPLVGPSAQRGFSHYLVISI